MQRRQRHAQACLTRRRCRRVRHACAWRCRRCIARVMSSGCLMRWARRYVQYHPLLILPMSTYQSEEATQLPCSSCRRKPDCEGRTPKRTPKAPEGQAARAACNPSSFLMDKIKMDPSFRRDDGHVVGIGRKSARNSMHIDIQGSGPDLVLIHGWAMHGGIFAPLTDVLATHFRLHVVDLPGHGFSRDDARFDVADCARRIASATPRALWIGWSLGGLVALRAALDHPANVRGLTMLASSPRFVSAPDWPYGVAASVFAEFDVELRNRYK